MFSDRASVKHQDRFAVAPPTRGVHKLPLTTLNPALTPTLPMRWAKTFSSEWGKLISSRPRGAFIQTAFVFGAAAAGRNAWVPAYRHRAQSLCIRCMVCPTANQGSPLRVSVVVPLEFELSLYIVASMHADVYSGFHDDGTPLIMYDVSWIATHGVGALTNPQTVLTIRQ